MGPTNRFAKKHCDENLRADPDLLVRDELDNLIWEKKEDVGGPTLATEGCCTLATGTPPPWSPRPCDAQHRPRGYPSCKQIKELTRTSKQALKSQEGIKELNLD
jgi:hypothetical protein